MLSALENQLHEDFVESHGDISPSGLPGWCADPVGAVRLPLDLRIACVHAHRGVFNPYAYYCMFLGGLARISEGKARPGIGPGRLKFEKFESNTSVAVGTIPKIPSRTNSDHPSRRSLRLQDQVSKGSDVSNDKNMRQTAMVSKGGHCTTGWAKVRAHYPPPSQLQLKPMSLNSALPRVQDTKYSGRATSLLPLFGSDLPSALLQVRTPR